MNAFTRILVLGCCLIILVSFGLSCDEENPRVGIEGSWTYENTDPEATHTTQILTFEKNTLTWTALFNQEVVSFFYSWGMKGNISVENVQEEITTFRFTIDEIWTYSSPDSEKTNWPAIPNMPGVQDVAKNETLNGTYKLEGGVLYFEVYLDPNRQDFPAADELVDPYVRL
jgi:hypothetical protein